MAQHDKNSVCLALYLRNHTSYDLNLRHTYVKGQYLQVFFLHFFQILIFGVSIAKNGPKWQKTMSVALHISGSIHHMNVIFATHL